MKRLTAPFPLLLLFFGIVLGSEITVNFEHQMVCSSVDKLRMREDASLSSKVIGYLEKGGQLLVTEKSATPDWVDGQQDYWYKVMSSSGTAGWVFGRYLRLSDDTIESVASRLFSINPHVRAGALKDLEGFDPESKARLIPRLVQALPLGDEAAQKRSAASEEALLCVGEPAIPALIASMDSRDTEWRSIVILGRMGPAAVGPLVETVRSSPSSMSRKNALIALGKIRPAQAYLLPFISRRLAYKNDDVGWAAAGAIAEMGAVGLPVLRQSLKSPDKIVRLRAAFTIGTMSLAGKPAVKDLASLLADPDSTVSASAATALRKIGTPDAQELLNRHKKTVTQKPSPGGQAASD